MTRRMSMALMGTSSMLATGPDECVETGAEVAAGISDSDTNNHFRSRSFDLHTSNKSL